MLPLTLCSPLLVPAGKESTSFHLLSEVGNGLFLPKRDDLDCSPLWTKCCTVGGLVVAGGVCPTVQGDICHVRATVLPPRINLPILQEFLKAFCRRGWPLVRCVGTHNRVPLTDELQDCHHGFFVQITITRAIPTHAVDVTRWCSEAGQPMHLDYQYYAGDSHQFLVGIAHGLTLLASSLAPCWSDRESWDEWLLMSYAIDTLLYVALLCIFMQCTPPSVTWMRAMTQGAPAWWQHQRDRLAAQRKRLLSSMCVCGLRASMMKGLCGALLPLPVVL